ncbi:MAG: nucleic acid-binding protein [Microgenomates group bacterium GW2011_GWC1_37_8]|nr:MAG: nucleic acid-binding protein [Microgenomates group bacterium GW2011_GWC1_37_8]
MNSLLVDTSVIIDYLRRKDKENSLIYKLSKKLDLKVSIITHAELYAGKSIWEKVPARKTLEVLFTGIKILPITKDLSIQAGKIKAEHSISLIDAIIAATSLKTKIQLVTLNTIHFSSIKGLKLFKIDRKIQ